MGYTLRTLTEKIVELDSEQAPGSETRLLGEYLDNMRTGTGVWPHDNITSDMPIDDNTAAWWIAAYEVQGELQAAYDSGLTDPDNTSSTDHLLTYGFLCPAVRFTVENSDESLGGPAPEYYSTAEDADLGAEDYRAMIVKVLTDGELCEPMALEDAEEWAKQAVVVTASIIEKRLEL